MSARLKGRRREAEAVVERFAEWVRQRADVRALGLIGSYARGTPRMASDVDLVLLTTDEQAYTDATDWLPILGRRARLIDTRSWGSVTERRARLASGLHVELDIGRPAWANTDPLDSGTRRVVSDGLRILHDPDRLLVGVRRAVLDDEVRRLDGHAPGGGRRPTPR